MTPEKKKKPTARLGVCPYCGQERVVVVLDSGHKVCVTCYLAGKR